MKPLLKALRLSVPAYLLGTGAFTVMFWVDLYMAVLGLLGGTFFLFLLPILELVAGALWYLALGVVWRFILRFLWDSPPQWMMPSKTWREVGINFAGCLVASLPVAIPIIIALSARSLLRMNGIQTYFRVDIAAIAIRFYWLWLLTATLYYYFLSRRQAKPVENPS